MLTDLALVIYLMCRQKCLKAECWGLCNVIIAFNNNSFMTYCIMTESY